jgi:DMSO/TMAO reductase YedYZ molybdopterin-dependent catalytic subunit
MHPDRSFRTDRRTFLGSTLGLAASTVWFSSCGGPEAPAEPEVVLPDGADADDFVVHGTNPWTFETKRDRLRDAITPTDKFFVRGNFPFPDASILADRDAWSLEVAGVANPGSITVGELKQMETTEIVAVLQCSGNGRLFFEHEVSGSPWGVGAAANVKWKGVPVRAVLERFGGAADGTKFLTGTGGDPLPEGLDAAKFAVERSIPLKDGIADAILAWELNGEPVNLSHGGPLRLVVPSYYGVNNVKYLKRLAATAEESAAKIQQTSYRVRDIGKRATSSQPSMWRMNVKSWIDAPLGEEKIAAGEIEITGVAFSGEGPIEAVEVSADGGATWQRAELLGEDLGRHAWRRFRLKWNAPAGTHTLSSRARDASGSVQPELRAENARGYAHNGWRDPSVTVQVG